MADWRERSFPACRLWERVGRDGKPFLSGLWGGCRVLVVLNRDQVDEHDGKWLMILGPNDATEHRTRSPRTAGVVSGDLPAAK